MAIIINSSSRSNLRVFNPDRMYFARLANKITPGSLVEDILARFPFQPPWLCLHPSLSADYRIRKAYRGSQFFLAQSYRHEKAYLNLIKAKSIALASKKKHAKFKHNLEESEEEYWQRLLLAQQLRSLNNFSHRAQKSLDLSRIFASLLAYAYRRSQRAHQRGVAKQLKRSRLSHGRYWKAVHANLKTNRTRPGKSLEETPKNQLPLSLEAKEKTLEKSSSIAIYKDMAKQEQERRQECILARKARLGAEAMLAKTLEEQRHEAQAQQRSLEAQFTLSLADDESVTEEKLGHSREHELVAYEQAPLTGASDEELFIRAHEASCDYALLSLAKNIKIHPRLKDDREYKKSDGPLINKPLAALVTQDPPANQGVPMFRADKRFGSSSSTEWLTGEAMNPRDELLMSAAEDSFLAKASDWQDQPPKPHAKKGEVLNRLMWQSWQEEDKAPPVKGFKPREPLQLIFDPKKNPSEQSQPEFFWETEKVLDLQLGLKSKQVTEELPQNARVFELPPDLQRGVYDYQYNFVAHRQHTDALPRKSPLGLSPEQKDWEFSPKLKISTEPSPYPGDEIDRLRNARDAQQLQLEKTPYRATKPRPEAKRDRQSEEKELLRKQQAGDTYQRQRDVVAIRFQSLPEETLAAHELQEKSQAPTRLGIAETHYQLHMQMHKQGQFQELRQVGYIHTRNAHGIIWQLNHPEPMKPKQKKSK